MQGGNMRTAGLRQAGIWAVCAITAGGLLSAPVRSTSSSEPSQQVAAVAPASDGQTHDESLKQQRLRGSDAKAEFIFEGFTSADLVYTPVSPCRIVDTRPGSPFGANTTRSFFVTGTGGFEAQGGNAGGCGIPELATAVMVNITAVDAPDKGFMRAWPFGDSPPNATVMNFGTGINVSNGIALPICDASATTCTHDVTMKVFNETIELVVDVVGFFWVSNPSWWLQNETKTGTDTTADPLGACTVTMASPINFTTRTDGQFLVEGSAVVEFTHTNGTDSGAVIFPTYSGPSASTGCPGTGSACATGSTGEAFIDANAPSGTYRHTVPFRCTVPVPTAEVSETFAFNVHGDETSGAATVNSVSLEVTFEPFPIASLFFDS